MKRWPEIRGGLIALAMFFGLVDGCPLPTPQKTPAWEKGFVEPVRSVQHVVLTPVAWMHHYLRIHQRWALYQAPRVDRYRLWIEGADAARTWHIVYRADDPEHQEFAERIDFRRSRGAWDPTTEPPSQYRFFAAWITDEVLRAHPEYVAARIRLEHVRLRHDGYDATGEFAYALERPR